MKKGMKSYFITGLLIIVPLYLTFYILSLLVSFMDSVAMMIPPVFRPDTYLPFHVPGLGAIITFLMIFIVGLLAQNFLGRKLVRMGERILDKIPLLRSVYKASKQLMETFFVSKDESFNKVVLIEYPRKGISSIGLVTGRTRGEVQDKTSESTVNIFIPTTPNPTSGYYIVVPEKDVIALDMTVEDAFKVIMSGGMVVPENNKGGKDS